MSKVSIVIAAYNVKEYIAATVSSAIAQTLKDIEIVIVDDCSTDGTFEIISEYAKLDSRIKVIRHKENQSVNVTRTEGIRHCTGDYIMLLDGDDALTPDACEKAYKAITEEQVDMLEFNIEIDFSEPSPNNEHVERELRTAMYSAKHKMVSLSKGGLLDKSAVGDIISFQLWNKIYKRELIQTAVTFVPSEYLNMAEDVLLSFFVQHHAKSYSYIDQRLYNYRYGCGMSTVAKLSEKLVKFIAKNAYVYDYIRNKVKELGTENECKIALQRVFTQLYTHISGVYFYRIDKDQRELFISEILKYTDPADLVLAFSSFIANGGISQEKAAEKCAALDMFKSKSTEAKTIGVYYFRVHNGGIENVISSLSDIWVKTGYNVVLFTDEEPNKDDYYINPAIKRVIVPKLTQRDFFNRLNRIEAFRKSLIENDIDIMVYNACLSPDIVLDSMIIKSCGINLIVHSHNLFCCETTSKHAPTALYFSSLPKLYSLVDTMVTLTDVDTAWWQLMGLKSIKTINPIQFDMNVTPSELNGKNILFVGRISEEKGVIDAIKIAELVKEEIPDIKLTVVGKGDDQNYINSIDNYISENKLDGIVDMVGFHSDMLPFYHCSDLLLCTSHAEGFGLALIESKICGLPMVTYELPNLDIIRENKGMTVVQQQDMRAAADAIVKILKDDTIKKEMGKAARESAENYLSLDLAQHWKNIFEQSLMPKPEPKSLYDLPAHETAVRIAVDNYTKGIEARMNNPVVIDGSAERCAFLAEEIERIMHSETVIVGKFVLFIPRMIKKLIKKIFKRK